MNLSIVALDSTIIEEILSNGKLRFSLESQNFQYVNIKVLLISISAKEAVWNIDLLNEPFQVFII
ncbi:MAG: hypothetical protein M1605_05860 [Candidatus Thermoplasmatota archaeon]|nr:hypothetical protein [Candidatus Thermoplasmatota archaeon]